MKSYVIGIDVGGTNIKLGLVDSQGKITARNNFLTAPYASSKKSLINALAVAIKELIRRGEVDKKSILGIGIGLPGLIDPAKGMVNFLPNIPGWKNVPLKEILEKKLHLPVFLDNDAKVVALGEWKLGAGKGFEHLVCLTLGTGVGSGLILDGRLYRGQTNTAGELGHVPLNEKGPLCHCGGSACLERTIGNRYLSEKAAQVYGKEMTPEQMGQRAQAGDARALRFWKEAATHLANGLVSVVNLLNPRCIVIGGGVANNFPYMEKTIKTVLKKRALKIPVKPLLIKKSLLGEDAGILGAQVLVRHATIR